MEQLVEGVAYQEAEIVTVGGVLAGTEEGVSAAIGRGAEKLAGIEDAVRAGTGDAACPEEEVPASGGEEEVSAEIIEEGGVLVEDDRVGRGMRRSLI